MKNNIEKEIKEKEIKNSKSKIIYNEKNLKQNCNKIIKSKGVLRQKYPKIEEKANIININNKSLTDWNKIKIGKKIIHNLPPAQHLYLKKKVSKPNKPINNCLISLTKKKNLSSTQEKIEKYTKKLICASKNISKKKNISDDISKYPDIDTEMEKELGNDDDEMKIHIPHMTGKKKVNYYLELQKTEIKNKNGKNASSDFNMKINNIIKKTKNQVELFPISKIDKRVDKYKKIIRAKTEKKKDDNNNERHNHKNFYLFYNNNDFINGGNSFLAFRNKKIENNIKKNTDDIFNSIKKKDTTNKKKDLNINIDNKEKDIEYNIINSPSTEYQKHLSKNVNISFINPKIIELNEINTNKNKSNNILNSNSDLISGKETLDSPENITDREEEKFTLPIHNINHFFIDEKKRCLEKFCRNSKNNNTTKSNKKYNKKSDKKFIFLSPNQNINFDLNNTDQNCYAHKSNISVNYTNSSTKDNISSYRNNINRFKNLASEKKIPLSLILSPVQKNNLFKETNKQIKKIDLNKYIKYKYWNIKIKKINLYEIFLNKEYKENKEIEFINIIKTNITNYFDIKSFLIISSLNKMFYKNYRNKLFNYLYKYSLDSNYNKQERDKFVNKIIETIFKYRSKKFKYITETELKTLYNSYKLKSKYDEDILKDLTRTFPKDKSFSKDSKNYKKLYNILTCYSNFNKSIGYTQGLNFIGAISIYLFESEEKSFLFLDSLINRFQLDNYYGIDNTNLIIRLSNYSNVLNNYIPDIISYLNNQQINHEFFSTGWILTLFSNSMKRKYLISSWAFMIIFGWKFFYSFVIQILIFYKKDIFNTNINELCFKMKSILHEETFHLNYNNIIKKTFDFMIKNIIL